MIRVGIADDQQLIRGGFRSLLQSEEGIDVVGEAGTGVEAVELVRAQRPDVLLMDIRMPDGDGLWATEQITADAALAHTRIVIVTTFELDEYVARAIRAGASGFLVKDTEPVELIRAVRVVATGEALLSPGVTRRLLRLVSPGIDLARPETGETGGAQHTGGALETGGARETNESRRALDVLTVREREVLGLVGEGLTNDEIGARLHLSPLTAKTHVSRIMTKLGARDRVRLVITAYEAGLVR